MKTILRANIAALVIGSFGMPAQADEFEESLQLALEAYQAGDINAAKEEIGYAAQLLTQLRAAALGGFLPEALPDWTRAEGDSSAAMMGFGGGLAASATYTRGSDIIEIQLMADNAMVNTMAVMFANPAMMGSMGELKRIKRQKVVINSQGELQALLEKRILIQITGRAPIEDKEAYFAAMDISGLKDF
jgi:hypothetical protein